VGQLRGNLDLAAKPLGAERGGEFGAEHLDGDLEVGNQFPDFELPDQDGKTQQLSKLIRRFPTVLIFSRGYY